MSLLRSVCSLHTTLVLALLAGAPGCSALLSPTDGGVGDAAPSRPPRHLAFEGATGTRMLRPGERLPFSVRYLEDDGTPVAGGTVSFALVGSAHDSSLDATSATTDGSGLAGGVLAAGTVSGAYELRATADRATPAHLDIAVSDVGFGSVRVTLRYDGARPFASRTVGVLAGAHCGGALVATALDRVVVAPAGAASVTVDALPAETTYAIVARGIGLEGRVLAEGCVEGTLVVADSTAAAAVQLADLPPQLSGAYDVALVVDAEASALAAGNAVVDAEATTLAGASDATFYLDAVEAHLHAAGLDASAAALQAARAGGTLDDDLAAALGAEGPTAAAALLGLRVADGTRGIVLGGVLTAPPDGHLTTGALALTDVLTSGLGDLTASPTRLSSAGAALRAPVASLDARVDPATAAFVVRMLVVRLPLGTASRAVLDARRALTGAADTAALLAPGAGCDALSSWAASQPDVAGVCDAACVTASCADALAHVGASVDHALSALDSTRAALALVGVALLVDANDDGIADGFGPATVAGTWGTGSTIDGDVVTAHLQAVHE